MHNNDEINKRLLKIKELSLLAKDDPELEIFESVIFNIDKKTKTRELKHELPWRAFLVPLLHLIQNDTDSAKNFWKMLNTWFVEQKIPLQNLDLEDVTFILSTLDKTNSPKSQKVLEKFKAYILANELLDEASPFITSDLIIKNKSGPAFETFDSDISEFIKASSYILIKAIIASFGISEIQRMPNLENFPSYDSMKVLAKNKLVGITKKEYKEAYDSYSEGFELEAKDPFYFGVPMEFGAIADFKKFPSELDLVDFFDLLWSDQIKGSTHFDLYIYALDYLKKLLQARNNILIRPFDKKLISSEELAYVIGSKTTKTIRNEFFKNNSLLKFNKDSKTMIKNSSAQRWIIDPKRKQPIYHPLAADSFPDITLDYIMEL